jgi:hypothetical protein
VEAASLVNRPKLLEVMAVYKEWTTPQKRKNLDESSDEENHDDKEDQVKKPKAAPAKVKEKESSTDEEDEEKEVEEEEKWTMGDDPAARDACPACDRTARIVEKLWKNLVNADPEV